MPSNEVISALEYLHRELEKLEPAILHVETAQLVTQTVKTIPDLHTKLLQSVKDDDARHKFELVTMFRQELTDLAEENRKLQHTTLEIQERAIAEQTALSSLKDKVEIFHERVEKINFPERLDKLDANVAGIMAAIQAITSRLDSVERNLTDRLRDMQDFHKETRVGIQTTIDQVKSTLETGIEKAAQRQKILTFITWGLIVIVVVLGFLTKEK
jgi:uncharacterized phage infection (PIP) family protein YhgE